MSAADPGMDPAQEAAAEQEAVRMEGSSLEPEEMAALTAVFARLRAGGGTAALAQQSPHTRTGRPDRTLRRRADLGLWARPGGDEWRRAAGSL